MLTGAERAVSFCASVGLLNDPAIIRSLKRTLKDYAADMRGEIEARVETVLSDWEYPRTTISAAVEAVRSTPFPGEAK